MRKIKYRCWFNNQMYYGIPAIRFNEAGVTRVDLNDDEHDFAQTPDTWTGMQDFELMQFTGLEDMNGREIYEGDVLRHNGPMKSEIRYLDEDAGFLLLNKQMGRLHPSKAFFSQHVEVIGNIYENPELLT